MKFVVRQTASSPAVPIAALAAMLACLFAMPLIRLPLHAETLSSDALLPKRNQPPSRSAESDATIPVRLTADANGDLAEIVINGRAFGHDDRAFERLSAEVLSAVTRLGNPLAKDVAVEITTDAALRYEHVIRVVSQCTGRIDPHTGQLVRYVETIRFAPPTNSPRSEDRGPLRE